MDYEIALREAEQQITCLQKQITRHVDDAQERAEVIAALKAEIEEYEKWGKEVKLDSSRVHELSDRQNEQIAALKAERDGYVKTHRENVVALLATNSRQAEEIERQAKLLKEIQEMIAVLLIFNPDLPDRKKYIDWLKERPTRLRLGEVISDQVIQVSNPGRQHLMKGGD